MYLMIHNTTRVPGHFHMTVGTAVAITLMSVAYWMIPYLTGRELWGRQVALASSSIYAIGALIFARGMISAGLEGMPRRFFRAQANFGNSAWNLGGILTAIGGTPMFIGILLFFVVILVTIVAGHPRSWAMDVPVSETLTALALTDWERGLDRLVLWTVAAVVLILIAHGPLLSHLFALVRFSRLPLLLKGRRGRGTAPLLRGGHRRVERARDGHPRPAASRVPRPERPERPERPGANGLTARSHPTPSPPHLCPVFGSSLSAIHRSWISVRAATADLAAPSRSSIATISSSYPISPSSTVRGSARAADPPLRSAGVEADHAT